MEKTEEQLIREAKTQYMREYREKNRKKIRQAQKKWQQANPDKLRQYQRNYWIKKAQENEKQA